MIAQGSQSGIILNLIFFFQGKMTNTFGMFLKYIQVKAFLTNLSLHVTVFIIVDEMR